MFPGLKLASILSSFRYRLSICQYSNIKSGCERLWPIVVKNSAYLMISRSRKIMQLVYYYNQYLGNGFTLFIVPKRKKRPKALLNHHLTVS
jgi:hypothetical protein